MNRLFGFLILAAVASTGAARAETFYIDVHAVEASSGATTPADSASRASARAEEHLRRLSGLSRLSIYQRAEKSGVAYAQAKVRYDRLVASTQFDLLVAALERNPHLEVVGR